MNFFESEILKGKYFPPKSRERLRATMVNLFTLIGIFMILLYAYENLKQGYYVMLGVEMLIVLTLAVVYLIFPHYIGINATSYMILGAFTFLLSISFVVPDKDPELSLFWLASLPIFVFFFLGVNKGIRWSTYMFVILLFIPLFSAVTGVEFVYEWKLISQILLAYLVVSYMVYIIEKERSSYEQRLSQALEENQILLKEVHHRTKNNLQVIMGLLETQSFKIDHPKYKKMFEAHVDRLKAMSLMHKNLYSNRSCEAVNIEEYVEEIVNSLRVFTPHTIMTQFDAMMLDMKSAMNIGLIVNEAVTNAIEHAFSKEEQGKIDVVFRREEGHCILIIQDNGRGFDVEKSYQSLGLTLIKDLASTLHNSSLIIKKSQGTLIQLYFDVEEPCQ